MNADEVKSLTDRVGPWMDKLNGIGAVSDELDDVVHDVASGLGSTANNGGLEAQVEFLLEHDAEDVLDKCYGVMLNERDNV